MHRHGYQGRKFGRERDQRAALLSGLAESLVIYESIETTLPKAKEVVPYMEKLITKAKKGDLHNRRQVLASLNTKESAHKLIDELAPKLMGRSSGHLRIERTGSRRGDNTQMARVSFITDDLKSSKTATSKAQPADQQKTDTKKHTEALHEHEKETLSPKTTSKISSKTANVKVAKRSGVRGNR